MGVIHQIYYCQDHWYRELKIPVIFPTFNSIKGRTNKEKEEYINYVIDMTCNLPCHKKVNLIKVYQGMKKTLNMTHSLVHTYVVISKTT